MKLILENWRKYCKQELILEALIREFDSSDRESLMSIGDQFTISYEIELESEDPIGEESSPTLDVDRARNYMNHDYFYESASTREADSIFQYDFKIQDAEDLADHYLVDELGCRLTCGENQQQAFLIAIALEEEPKFQDNLLKFFAGTSEKSDTNPIITSHLMNFVSMSPEEFKQLGLEIYEDKQIQMPFENGIEWKTGQGPFIQAVRDGGELARITQNEDGKYEVDSNLEKLRLANASGASPEDKKRAVVDWLRTRSKTPLLYDTLEDAKTAVETAAIKPVFRAKGLSNFIYKYFFNLMDADKERYELEDLPGVEEAVFPNIGLLDFLSYFNNEEYSDLADELRGLAEVALGNIINPGQYTTAEEIVGGYGYTQDKHPILWAVQQQISDEMQENIEKEADREYQEYQDDPIDFLENFGIDVNEEFGTTMEGEDYEDMLKEHLPNFMKEYGDKLKFESDASLSNGVEFSMDTPKFLIGLDEAFKFLKLFFEDYNNQTNFSFDEKTGLHTNIGFLAKEDSEEASDPLNLIKGLLFLNDDFAKKGFENRKNSRWARDIKDIAIKYISGNPEHARAPKYTDLLKNKEGIKELSSVLSAKVLKAAQMAGAKSLGMNITYINSLNYIEFRYPGNVDPTYDRMVDATLYYSHIVRTIFDKTYKRREFLQKLSGFLSNLEEDTASSARAGGKSLKGMMLAGAGTVFMLDMSMSKGWFGQNWKVRKAKELNMGDIQTFLIVRSGGAKPPPTAKLTMGQRIGVHETDLYDGDQISKIRRMWEAELGTAFSHDAVPIDSNHIPMIYNGLKRIDKKGKKSKENYVAVFYSPALRNSDTSTWESSSNVTGLASWSYKVPGPDVGLTFERHEVPLLQLLGGEVNDYHLFDADLIQAPEGSEEEKKRNNALTLMGYMAAKDDLKKLAFASGEVAEAIAYLKRKFKRFKKRR